MKHYTKYAHDYSKPATVAELLHAATAAIASDDTHTALGILYNAREVLDAYLAYDNVYKVSDDDMVFPCYVNYNDIEGDEEKV